MSKLYENPEICAEASELVNSYIIHRANELASFAFQSAYGHDEFDFESFVESMVKRNPDDAAKDWHSNLDADELAEILANHEMTEQELMDQILEDPEQVCYDHDIEPYDVDIFEFWVVDSWFANRLAERGEAIGELFDFKIWGRSTTGQAIMMDYIVLSIAAENVKAREG